MIYKYRGEKLTAKTKLCTATVERMHLHETRCVALLSQVSSLRGPKEDAATYLPAWSLADLF